MGHSRPLFLYFRFFNTVDCKQMFNINFADDWIQTAHLGYCKQPLYQVSHNHVSSCLFIFVSSSILCYFQCCTVWWKLFVLAWHKFTSTNLKLCSTYLDYQMEMLHRFTKNLKYNFYSLYLKFFNKGQSKPLSYFRSFHVTIQIYFVKALLLCLLFRPGSAGL